MEKLYEEGKLRAIGVSNFEPAQIVDLIAYNRIVPAIDQIETNLYCQRSEERKWLDKKNVAHMSYAPLGQGNRNDMFSEPEVTALAEKYHKSEAQVLLRFLTQKGIIVIPRSTEPEHIRENFDIFDFTLTEDELSKYVDSYIDEGYFNNDGALYLFPVAKSTEIMMINATDWQTFADATGASLDELSTLEGVTETAKRYYEWTDSLTPDVPDDGKAFYGRDSMSNYFIIGMKQMGKEIFQVKDGKMTLNTDEDLIRRLWDNYYVPYMKGYFASLGKFRSDDVKTGDILAYTGSTSSAVYFPDTVETGNKSYPIDYIVCDSPVMEGGENIKVQQGAGMAVTKSDEEHEYAASVFLKWFTQKDQNLRFVCESSYMPVLKEANSVDALDSVIKENNIEVNQKVYDCFTTEMEDFDKTSFYTIGAFDNSYSARKILDYSLADKAKADKDAMDAAIADGESREEALAQYLTDENFQNWYTEFCHSLECI